MEPRKKLMSDEVVLTGLCLGSVLLAPRRPLLGSAVCQPPAAWLLSAVAVGCGLCALLAML